MHPKLQISLFNPYGFPPQTSGEAKYGVPVCVFKRPDLATFDTFKSPSLHIPFFIKNIFALFKSLCTIFLSCNSLIPYTI